MSSELATSQEGESNTDNALKTFQRKIIRKLEF